MIDVRKKVQKRIVDSLQTVERGNANAFFEESKKDFNRFEDQGIQAGILSNFQRVTDSVEGRDFIKSSNYGPFLPELWPIITAWYPEFPLKDLVSVQDMEQDLAYIITSELLAGTNKSDTFMGDKVETPTGVRNLKGRYPTGEIFGEELLGDDLVLESTNTVAALAYMPLLVAADDLANTKVEVWNAAKTVKSATYHAGSVSGGKVTLLDASEAAVGTIEIATGILSITAKDLTAGALIVSYVWNIEFANDENIPTVIEDMKMVAIQAKPQVLAMKWTIFAEYIKKKQFGIDIRTQNTKRVLDLLYQYQVRYILDKLYNGATGAAQTVTFPTLGTDLNVRVQNFLQQLNTISNVIQVNTGRIEGNKLVVGNDAKSYLESLPDIFFKPEAKGKDYGFNGPRKIGEIGRFDVFFDNKLGDAEGFMTYKGSEWYDAAAYYGVFLPIAPTDVININIHARQAFVTMTAFKLDKPAAICKITFS